MTLNLEELTGFSLDIFIAALAAVVVILLIIVIINGVKMTKLKKKYRIFMSGENAQSLEDTILKRMDQIDELVDSDKENKQKIQTVMDHLDQTYQIRYYVDVILHLQI